MSAHLNIFIADYKILHRPVKHHSIVHVEKNVRARTCELFYRGRVRLRAGRRSLGVFVAQRSSQGLVVVARTIVNVWNDWFPFVVAVRKSPSRLES